MDGIVKGQFVGQEGGNFPVDVETFQQLQEYIDGVAELANMYVGEGMNGAILSGCELTDGGTRRNAGWLVLSGLGLVYFVGGLVDDGFSVVEDTINVTAQGVTYPAYKRRQAISGSIINGNQGFYRWEDIAERTNLIDARHLVPVGTMMLCAPDEMPAGGKWLKCDGRYLDVDAYPLLFEKIGNKFTSSITSRMFQLPNAKIAVSIGGRGTVDVYYIIKAK